MLPKSIRPCCPALVLTILPAQGPPTTAAAVAIVSATLSGEQLRELVLAGALPRPWSATRSMGVGAGGRRVAALPDAMVDLAVTFDPAMDRVLAVVLRTASKAGSATRVVVGGGRRGAAAPDADGPTTDDARPDAARDQAAQAVALRFVDGLPVRPRDGLMVVDYEVRLRDHGEAPQPALDDAQRRLLGR